MPSPQIHKSSPAPGIPELPSMTPASQLPCLTSSIICDTPDTPSDDTRKHAPYVPFFDSDPHDLKARPVIFACNNAEISVRTTIGHTGQTILGLPQQAIVIVRLELGGHTSLAIGVDGGPVKHIALFDFSKGLVSMDALETEEMIWVMSASASPVSDALDPCGYKLPLMFIPQVRIHFRSITSFWYFAYITTGGIEYRTMLALGHGLNLQIGLYRALFDREKAVEYPHRTAFDDATMAA